ncbi:hypothetical protein [Micromonospora sp. NPDC047074]|uniref:hypothetical protein n=1 Tax=Micromonospora sp. NPDC047074 TaxID=3154339 RepID=UPI0033F0D94F
MVAIGFGLGLELVKMGVEGLLSLAEAFALHLLPQVIEPLLDLPQSDAGGRTEPAPELFVTVVAHRLLN